MPADDALGSDDDQMPAPITAERTDHDPKEFVASAEPRSLPGRPGQHRELMTEQEILGDQCLTVAFDKPVWPTSMLRYGPPVWGLSMFTSPGSATGVWSRSSLL